MKNFFVKTLAIMLALGAAFTATGAAAQSGSLTISDAWYGTEANNVRKIGNKLLIDTLRSSVVNGVLMIPSNMNDVFGGDPFPGVAKTLAVRTAWPAPKTRPIAACTDIAAVVRSAKGCSRATRKAEFDCAPPSISEKPTMASVPCTEGMARRMPSTCSTTTRVRATEAPCGSCTCTRIAAGSVVKLSVENL